MPQDPQAEFAEKTDLFSWMSEWTGKADDDQIVRATLGRLLFSGDETKKSVQVLSGGEKGRMIYGKLMLTPAECAAHGRAHEPHGHGNDRVACRSGWKSIPGQSFLSLMTESSWARWQRVSSSSRPTAILPTSAVRTMST